MLAPRPPPVFPCAGIQWSWKVRRSAAGELQTNLLNPISLAEMHHVHAKSRDQGFGFDGSIFDGNEQPRGIDIQNALPHPRFRSRSSLTSTS